MRDKIDGMGSLAALSGESFAARMPKTEIEEDEASCAAFGYLRGVRDRALVIEFRLRNGDREYFPYSWLGPWRFDPSVGLLLKFTGDLVTLVLIRGSNLDAAPNGINLTDRGLQRHRITWVRELDEDELRRAGDGICTVDRIEIGEFESRKDETIWLASTAPSFMRR
jgi:hypothetical protein